MSEPPPVVDARNVQLPVASADAVPAVTDAVAVDARRSSPSVLDPSVLGLSVTVPIVALVAAIVGDAGFGVSVGITMKEMSSSPEVSAPELLAKVRLRFGPLDVSEP